MAAPTAQKQISQRRSRPRSARAEIHWYLPIAAASVKQWRGDWLSLVVRVDSPSSQETAASQKINGNRTGRFEGDVRPFAEIVLRSNHH
jgi:hypothetical protein